MVDEWSKKYSHKDLLIHQHAACIQFTTNSIQTAFGTHLVEQGVFCWRLRIMSIEHDDLEPAHLHIGVIENNISVFQTYKCTSWWDDCGYQLHS